MTITARRRPTAMDRLTSYAAGDAVGDQDGNELVIPDADGIAALGEEELAALHESALEAFDALYGDGSQLSAEEYAQLGTLTEGIEALAAEMTRRADEAAERTEAAASLAARVRPEMSADVDDGADGADDADDSDIDGDGDDEDADDGEEDAEPADEEGELVGAGAGSGSSRASIVASSAARTEVRMPMPKRKGRMSQSARRAAMGQALVEEMSMRDVAFSTNENLGFAANAPMDWTDAGKAYGKRLGSFVRSQYEAAAKRGQHIREQASIMAFRRPMPKDLIVASMDPMHIEETLKRAVSFDRLPGNSLTAAGWCAPGEVLYDLCALESRDGLYSLPEIGITRGGISVPLDPTFQEIYDDFPGFCFTAEDAENGRFAPGENPGDPNVVGDKPCYEIPCPEWVDYELEGCGICITGDVIQQRGYPEGMGRYMSGILIAHDHRMSARDLQKVIAGSTAVTMTAGTVGTTAPLLAAIELQVEHYRYVNRMARSSVLEAVFPFWVHAAIRQDLSVRLGLAIFDVTDAQIDAWFRLRGIAPQFVYDWQSIGGAATAFTTWPSTVSFLLYAAGTWVKGVQDLLTLDSLYDSTLLGQNKYTALFTEDASLIAKRCVDSRVVTVPVCSDGSTHAGVLLNCDLAPTPEPEQG